ncbi:MAG: HK97 family phage prohead protease [Saprospirales bacterium]|nr:HK97 family phage prohead protease [Saprospirales bacterium]
MEQKEIRVFNSEMRMEGDEESRKVVGYAAVYNSDSEEMWGFKERIAPGAFEAALGDDVRALFNHDANMLLARTKSGTLKLSSDKTGLKYEFEAPKTTAGNDLLEMLKRGDVSQSSFAFTVEEQSWSEKDGEMPIRTIVKVKRLYDVSPVTYPAYPDTTAAKRSLDEFRAETAPPQKKASIRRPYWRQIHNSNK